MLLQAYNNSVSILMCSTNNAIFMKTETVLLSDLVAQDGQIKAADKIGCHQTAISAAIKKGREIYLEVRNGSVVSGFEVKPALNLPFHKNKKA